ncbi:hypothetical protein HK101_002513 [Irineochytrium annulatum]|nr:hypothetical protein HK101_002513 [Irineochytrium annulatum]
MARIPCNCADVPDLCDFFFVATHRDGPIQIGISTNGCGPRMAARIRTHIRDTLPRGSREAVERIGRLRQLVRASDPDPQAAGRRMNWLSRLCDSWSVEEMAAIGEGEVVALLEAYEKGEKVPPPPSTGRPLSSNTAGLPLGRSGSVGGGSTASTSTVVGNGAYVNGNAGGGRPQQNQQQSPRTMSQALGGAVAGAAGLAASIALSPITLTAAVVSGTIGAASSVTSSAVSTVTAAGHTVTKGVWMAGEQAASYSAGAVQYTGGIVTATVEGGLGVLPVFVASPIRRVMTAVVPRVILPLRDSSGATNVPRVFLVGAGPGDPGLLTVRALELLRTADVVVSDQLVGELILRCVPKRTRLVFVERKAKGKSDVAQADANELVLRELRAGRTVVRLKGGDPFLFGRGGEEIMYLREHGFEAVVVPGVSSAIAAPGAAGIPVTHRGVSDQLLVLSARGENGSMPEPPTWNEKRTTVVMMPVARMGALSDLLVDAGYPSSTPAAVVEKGSCEGQRVVEGTLEDIAGRVKAEDVGSPALLVVGNVCKVLRGGVSARHESPAPAFANMDAEEGAVSSGTEDAAFGTGFGRKAWAGVNGKRDGGFLEGVPDGVVNGVYVNGSHP